MRCFKSLKIYSNSIPVLTEREAYTALEEYVGTKCCYSTKPLQTMKITSLTSDHAYRVH